MRRTHTMLSQVEAYLAYRRKLGFKLRTEGRLLLQFARHADEHGHKGPVTTDLAVEWARLPRNAAPLYWARRLEIVRCFARHQAILDPDTDIPADGLLGPAHCRKAPYIYSRTEIALLLKTAAQLSPGGGLRPQTYVTLLGLLACSGLRISEALKLTRDDVDLKHGVMTIRETKFHKSRLVPLHPSARKKLSQYARFRDVCHPATESKAFFLNERGSSLTYSTVRHTFGKLRQYLGLKSTEGKRPPRIHDLRHTFVCRQILHWYEEGADVDYYLSVLSTYIGHAKVTDTYWYVTGIPELLAAGASRFERFATLRKRGRR